MESSDLDSTVVSPSLGNIAGSTVVIAGGNVNIESNGNVLSVRQEYWPDFSELIAEKTRFFIGRGFVFQALQDFLASEPRGYFRIMAAAGLGKTAIAAEVAARYRAPAYFFSATEGRTSPETALNALSAQLIVQCGLPHTSMPVTAGATSDFVYQCMEEAAATQPSERIVLLIDALDEAEPVPPGHNWLHLPSKLPRGVYVVLTSRPFNYTLRTDVEMQVRPTDLMISADDTAQRQDVEAFLRERVRQPDIQAVLASASPPISPNDFVSTLATRSTGNFMYVTYVVKSIERETAGAPLKLAELPTGLDEYYRWFWVQMKPSIANVADWTNWETLFRPVIELLGVAQQPVTLEWLANQTGQSAGLIRNVALERWTRFLSWRNTTGLETWQIVHRSFADFLNEQAQAGEVDLAAANHRVAEYYAGPRWGNWSGWDDYGLRFAAAHLVQAAEHAPDGASRGIMLQRLVALVDDAGFRRVHLDRLHAPDALQRDLQRAMDLMANAGPSEVPLIARAASALAGARTEVLDPAELFKHAEEGQIEAANRQLALYEVEPNSEWQAALRLIIAWLGDAADPVAARELFNRSRLPAPGPTLNLLQGRVRAALDGDPEPSLPPLPPPPDALLAEAIVARLGGSTDQRLLAETANLLAGIQSMSAAGGSMMTADDIEFLAAADAPLLVSLAVSNRALGDEYLSQYLKVHSRYSYITYRRGSLWVLLDAVLRHPDPMWARTMAVAVGRTALVGGDVEFEEAMAYTTLALAAQAREPGALTRWVSRFTPEVGVDGPLGPLQEFGSTARRAPPPELLTASVGASADAKHSDRWGVRKRRLGALAEAAALLLQDQVTAQMLIDEAMELPFGFAGYQAPACLNLADSILIAAGNDMAKINASLDAAREAAHNVQDPTLCARTTARANAVRLRWWQSGQLASASVLAKRLRLEPYSPDFTALHIVGEDYAARSPVGRPLPASVRTAASIGELAKVYQRPLSEFLRVNPELSNNPDSGVPPATWVNVPDPRFITMLAARTAAQALVEAGLSDAQRIAIIWSLVPVAASNPTALDTVLARLLMAAASQARAALPELESIAQRGASRSAASIDSTVPVNLPG